MQVVALHKDRYVFPVTLKVTKIMGTGVDATFMGIMKVGCRPAATAVPSSHLHLAVTTALGL
jgi:hypothetical protein